MIKPQPLPSVHHDNKEQCWIPQREMLKINNVEENGAYAH